MQTRRALLSGGAAIAALGMAPAEKILLLGGATTAPSLDLNFVQNPTLDSRITFTRASGATYFDSTNTLQTAATNTARFDYGATSTTPLGLLIEEARTNSIRNNTMVGTSAPATFPTNWSQSFGTGVGFTIIGTGSENGIAYIDVQILGTTTAANDSILIEGLTQIAATTGQTWSMSAYVRLVGGSAGNVTTRLVMRETTSGGATVLNNNATGFIPTSAGLATQWQTYTSTLSGGVTTAFIVPIFQVVCPAGSVNVTLRVGLPQIELGGFATSAITTSVAAATRAADVATMPVTVAQGAPGSIEVEYLPEYAGTAASANFALSLDNGSASDRYALRSKSAAASVARAVITSASSDALTGTLLTDVVGTTSKLALAWSGGTSQNGVGNAGTVRSASGAAPTGTLTTLSLGNTATANQLNGWLRRTSYWPRALSNTELQQVTK